MIIFGDSRISLLRSVGQMKGKVWLKDNETTGHDGTVLESQFTTGQ